MGKGEIAHNEQFLLFPQCFLPFWRNFCHFHQIQNCRLQTLSDWKSLKFVVWERVNPFQNKPWFFCVCSTSLLKTLWEKEKLLIMSNFSFSYSVFYPFGELSAIFIKFEICQLLTLLVWKSLKFVVWERAKSLDAFVNIGTKINPDQKAKLGKSNQQHEIHFVTYRYLAQNRFEIANKWALFRGRKYQNCLAKSKH